MANTYIDTQLTPGHRNKPTPWDRWKGLSTGRRLGLAALATTVVIGANAFTGNFSSAAEENVQPDTTPYTFMLGDTGNVFDFVENNFGEEIHTGSMVQRILDESGIDDIGSIQPNQPLTVSLTSDELDILDSHRQQASDS